MPPKRKNKPSKNGFWPFVMECRDKPHNKNLNMEQVKDYAARKWANMSKDEKAPYERMAQVTKDNYAPVKYTSEGLCVDEILRQEEEKQAKIMKMKNDIKDTLKTSKMCNSLENEMFFIVHVNHLIYSEQKDRYYICEISIACFNLKNGVNTQDVFHKVVKPGKLPLGTYGPAKIHSKETHQLLEVVQEEPYDDNTEEVFKMMIQYLKKYSKDRIPVLYTTEKNMQMTQKVMDTFCDDFNFRDAIKVYNLEYMFYILKNEAADRQVWPSETFSYTEIENDPFSYVSKLACEFHDLADITVHCSRSIVIRYGFTICDKCCLDLGIEVVPGWHVPEKARIQTKSTLSTRCNSVSSVYSGASSRFKPQTAEDSLESSSYDTNFPSLGGVSSSSRSVSSMSFKTLMNSKSTASAKNISDAFNSMTLEAQRRSDASKKLKFPPRGFSSQESQ